MTEKPFIHKFAFKNVKSNFIFHDQFAKIFQNIAMNKEKWVGMRDLSIILLMWGYGLRISEVINIRLSDLQTNDLQINGKGNKTRLIPIAEEVRVFLKEMISFCSVLNYHL